MVMACHLAPSGVRGTLVLEVLSYLICQIVLHQRFYTEPRGGTAPHKKTPVDDARMSLVR
jgi:hypothetical protein